MPKTPTSSSSGLIPSSIDAPYQQLMESVFDLKMMESELKDTRLDFHMKPLNEYTQSDVTKGGKFMKTLFKSEFESVSSLFDERRPVDDKTKKKTREARYMREKKEDEGLEKFNKMFPSVAGGYDKNYDSSHMEKAVHFVAEVLPCVKDCAFVKSAPENVLKVQLKLVDKSSENYKLIDEYLKNGTSIERRTDIINVFEIQKTNETAAAIPGEKKPEKKKTAGKKGPKEEKTLLWLGTPRWNMAKILSGKLEKDFGNEKPGPGMFGQEVVLDYMLDKPMAGKIWEFAKESANEEPRGGKYGKGIVVHNMFDGAIDKTRATRGSSFSLLLVEADLKKATLREGKTYPDPEGTVKTEEGVGIPLGNKKYRYDKCDAKYERKDEYNTYRLTDLGKIEMKYIVHVQFRVF